MEIQLKKDTSLEVTGDTLTVKSVSFQINWIKAPFSAMEALRHLKEQAIEEESLGSILQEEDEQAKSEWFYFLERLKQKGFFKYQSSLNGKPFVTWIPLKDAFFPLGFLAKEKWVQLSRFSVVRLENNKWVLETPLFPGKIILMHGDASLILHTLCEGTTQKRLCEQFSHLPTSLIEDFLALLSSGKFLSVEEEEKQFPFFYWEFHNLFFHSRSRVGRHELLTGGHYPFKGIADPPSKLKEKGPSAPIFLYKPDIEKLKKEDLPFTRVLEERRSIRESRGRHLDIQKLGEFLYRSSRQTHIKTLQGREENRRPYPNGGALYELDIYPIIHTCEGIQKGMYKYDSEEHTLIQILTEDEKIEKFLRHAKHAMIVEKYPQVLFVVSAKFYHVFWKYCAMSYAVILKNAGALIQTFYLVGTAMGLSPCAIGSGDSDLFCEATGKDYLQETSVAEFVLN